MNVAQIVELIAAVARAGAPVLANLLAVVKDPNAVALFHKLQQDKGTAAFTDAVELLKVVLADLQANPPAAG